MDFAAMFQTWLNVLTKPGEATFEEELGKPHATLGTSVIWIVMAAVLAAFFGIFGALLDGLIGGGSSMMQALAGADIPPEALAFMAASTGGGVVGGFFCTLILTPIFFLIFSAIYFGVAKLVGGEGDFERQTFALATFTAPLMIVNAALQVIPILGGCAAFALYIYQVVLTYFAVKVAHNLTTGKALIVTLVPLIICLICAGIFVAGIVMLVIGGLASSGY